MLQRKAPLRSKTQMKTKSPLKAKTKMKRGVMQSTGKVQKTSTLKSKRPKTSKIRQSANGQPCMARIPGVCNGRTDTTVLAHLNGAGVGAKASDHEGAYTCFDCHAWLDGGYARQGYTRDTRDLWHLQAVMRTIRVLIEQGFITIKGAA